ATEAGGAQGVLGLGNQAHADGIEQRTCQSGKNEEFRWACIPRRTWCATHGPSAFLFAFFEKRSAQANRRMDGNGHENLGDRGEGPDQERGLKGGAVRSFFDREGREVDGGAARIFSVLVGFGVGAACEAIGSLRPNRMERSVFVRHAAAGKGA